MASRVRAMPNGVGRAGTPLARGGNPSAPGARVIAGSKTGQARGSRTGIAKANVAGKGVGRK